MELDELCDTIGQNGEADTIGQLLAELTHWEPDNPDIKDACRDINESFRDSHSDDEIEHMQRCRRLRRDELKAEASKHA
jgi:hypothetical protein